jgi:hypothetical protein
LARGRLLIALIALGAAVTVSVIVGVYAILFNLQDTCADLTFGFLFDFVPIWGFGLVLLLSTVWARSWVSSKYADETVDSIFIEIVLIHSVVISALLVTVMAFFPDAKYLYQQVTCSYNGDTYFARTGAPFVLGTWFCWMLFTVIFMFSERHASNI